jgi:16S rRNA processing protein RimM
VTPDPDRPSIAVGTVARAHGVRGEVAIRVHSDNPERFAPGNVFFLEDGRSLTVASSRPHGARTLVRFEGIDDRSAADTLRGATLLVPESALPPLPEGSFWPHELEGCELVVEGEGRVLGTIRDVLHTPANDVWVADGPDGEVLVPALREVVAEVDVASRRVVVRPVPGLTVPEEPDRR